jgi:hypothetical protein
MWGAWGGRSAPEEAACTIGKADRLVIIHRAEKQPFLNPHDFNLQCMKFVSNKLKSKNGWHHS